AGAPARLLDEQRAHRISDLTPTSIPNRDVHNQAGSAGCGLTRVFQDTGGLIGQEVEGADGLDVPAVGGELADGVLDDLQQRFELAGGPVQVVGGQQPQRDDLDPRLRAPRQQLGDLLGAALVPGVDVGQPHRPGPTPVPVQYHADVPGDDVGRQVGLDPP